MIEKALTGDLQPKTCYEDGVNNICIEISEVYKVRQILRLRLIFLSFPIMHSLHYSNIFTDKKHRVKNVEFYWKPWKCISLESSSDFGACRMCAESLCKHSYFVPNVR